MYLKSLEIQGFKSFVDKIKLDFGVGITTVVGPNGSGKSNISDAVRWVLGEQSAKSLRGGKMEDIIFVGTESRRPVGFAEVSIIIDNSQNILPIEFQEVKVTRRLFRSGESEYLINMSQCRLKDIQQLFFDTGIGVDGYSIIGQGQVDSILSGKVDERRAIFEEASGIMKYKTRKIEAERKLVLTTQNIERISDIIYELENQIETLSEQSETAKQYLSLKEELKDYEISVYVDSISRFRKQLGDLEIKYSAVKIDLEEQSAALENIKTENEEKNTLYKQLEEELDKIRNEYYENEKQLSEHGADVKIRYEKIKNIEESNSKMELEIQEENLLKEQYISNLKIYEEEIKALDEVRKNDELNLKELEDKYSYIMNLMSERAKKVEELRNTLAQLNLKHSQNISDISARNQMLAGNQSRKMAIVKEIENLDKETDEVDNIKNTSKEAEEELSSGINKLQEEKNKYTRIREKEESRLSELRKEASELSAEYQFKTSRLNLLNEMDEKMEGYQRSVKEIISSVKGKETFINGVKGTIAQLIEVEKKYEIAIETALGQAFQYIVTDTENTAKEAIEYLRRNNMGRATFLPMTAVNGKKLEHDAVGKLSRMKGYIGLGYEIIQYDNMYHNVMLSQLGKVAIAEDLDCAIEIAREFKYSFKIITLKGDIIRPSGAMTGGSTDKTNSSGIIGRSREIEELTERTKELGRIIKDMNDEAVQSTVKISNSTMEAGKLEAERRGLEIRLVEAQSVSIRLEERKQEIARRKNNLYKDIEDLKDSTVKISGEIEELNKIKAEYESAIIVNQNETDKSESDNSTGRAAVDAMNNQLTEKKLAVNNVLHKINTTKEACGRIQNSISESDADIKEKKEQISSNQNIIKDMQALNEKIEEAIEKYIETKTGQGGRIEKMSFDKQKLSDEILGMTNKIADISKNIYMLQEEFGRIEVRKAKIETEEENVKSKLWEDYEITYTNAGEYVKDKELGSYTSMQKYISELKGKISDLGVININAIDDYKNTKERLEFLSTQMEDLEESKVKLEKIIHDMSVIMKKQFVEHFELINQSFNSVFRELFDGGRANVYLTDNDNVLESPIEIEAQPPGKKLQNMMLLSGGEKAMTAISLLFAVLKLKPTPFCILDEIEAALDDTNVIRFAEYITRFSEKTQFVIITHRKGTMEAADVLYGVTMEERGISKIVSLKFNKD